MSGVHIGSTEIKSLRLWNGAAWDQKPVRMWNGAAWAQVNLKQFTFNPTLTDSICPGSYPSGKWRTSNDYMYQGVWEQAESYNNIGYAWFDVADIQAKLAGKKIIQVEAYLFRNDGSGPGGATPIDIYGSRMPQSMRGDTSVTLAVGASYLFGETENALSLGRGAGAWGNIANAVGEELRDGTAHGFAIYATPVAYSADYAICASPQLRITCY